MQLSQEFTAPITYLPNVLKTNVIEQFGYNTPEGVARHAAITAFVRSMTYSFGSICFGSLCVSIIQFLKQFFTTVRSAVHQSLGDTCYQTAFFCLEWLAIWMEGIMEYFNHYAFTEMALTGKV